MRAVATWFALLVLVVAVVVSPTLRTALGAWIGCLWLVVCWFALARAKTVSWALTSGVLATGMPLALLIGMVSLWVCSAAGVTPSDTAASIVVASVVEEVLKLTPLAVLALAAPGRVRRFLVSDWIVLGVAAGAAFEAVEEVTRRIRLLTSGGSLLDSLLCPEGGVRQLKCNGATTYSLSPFSGAAGNVFPYAGHAVVTGLVAGAIGLGIALWRRGRVHRGGYRAALQILAPVVPLWTWWVAVVDHMGRNASDYVLWLQTGGEAPWWPIEVTASITGYGHGRGVILLLMLTLAWVIDSRTLWGGGYVSTLESDNYGNRWGPWRWRVWAGVPRNAFGRFLADGACLVSVVGVEWRWAWMTLMEAAAFREPRLLLATPAKLRIAREEAARAELDPAPEQWWRVRLTGLCAVVAGLLVIAMVPGLTQSMADSLGEGSAHWLAGLLDALGAAWESLSWEQKLGLMLFAGAMILFTGGTLGLAFEVGMGVATVFGAARGAAALMRDPRGTTARYLSTHTPAEIALDLAAAALTTVGGGAASAMGGQMARGAYAATREARYASWLWRTDRTAWRHYVRNARRRLIHDETGAASTSMWSPRNGLHYPGLRTPRPGRSDGGPGLWGKGKNYGSARSQLYEEQITRVPIEQSYIVNGVEFDGFDGFALIDAKGPGYANPIKGSWSNEPKSTYKTDPDTGEVKRVKKGLLQIGKDQVKAVRATGTDTPIQWHIAEKETFDELWRQQNKGKFPPEIELILTPPN
ncbi:restriction endonuclease fold toxin 5 domain-containing protein [Actinomyces sp. oral taxon 169]|uniref:restriction endonuclease fold toxin 5 domain-containing protein n=1 Tax=Actinomyces sp. oral taxon 169 TaxID=712116 RepID=UPI0021B144EA|nr:restriction endonuclease fold toxin 5 domain-containing protein [Actinomyces sp. oral taxon 169]